jgi:hypothetical protein
MDRLRERVLSRQGFPEVFANHASRERDFGSNENSSCVLRDARRGVPFRFE